ACAGIGDDALSKHIVRPRGASGGISDSTRRNGERRTGAYPVIRRDLPATDELSRHSADLQRFVRANRQLVNPGQFEKMSVVVVDYRPFQSPVEHIGDVLRI